MYYSLFVIWISHFLMDFMLGVWPVFKTLAGLDIAKAGLVAGLSMFLGEALQLWFGYLSDRGWQRKLAIMGILMTGSVALLAYTQNYLLLFFLVFFLYMGSSAFHPAAIGMIGDWFNGKNGLFVTLFFSGGTLGAALSQTLFTKTYHYFGGHTWILLIPIAILAVWLMINPFPVQQKEPTKINLKELRPYRHIVGLFFSILLCAQAMTLSVMFLLPDLLQGRYEEWFVFGGAHACFVIGSALLSIPAGYLTDRFGERTVLIWTTAIGCAAYYTFLMNPTIPLPTAAILLFLMGGMLGVVNPVIVATSCKIVPRSASSLVGGFLMGMSACLSGIILIGTSILVSIFEQNGAVIALEICGVLFIGMLALLRLFDSVQLKVRLHQQTSPNESLHVNQIH